jgi:hypothetical protein
MKFASSKEVLLILLLCHPKPCQDLIKCHREEHRTRSCDTRCCDRFGKTMLGGKCAQRLRTMTQSPDLPEYEYSEQLLLVENVRNKCFSIQIDDVTDCCALVDSLRAIYSQLDPIRRWGLFLTIGPNSGFI